MRGARIWKLSLCAACLLAAALLGGCGIFGSSRPADDQTEQLVRALQEKEELQMRLARMEQRLADLERSRSDPPPARQPGGQSPLLAPRREEAPAPPLQQQSPYSAGEMTRVPLTSAAPAAPAPVKPAVRPAGRAPAAPPAAYQKALSLLLDQSKPEESRTAFSVFLTENPDGPFTPNALYWVGETYYTEKKYADAILLFKDVTARFPKHDKAPDALLKAVFSYRQLNDGENAAYLEKLLLTDYPNSRAVGLLGQRGG